MSLLGRSVLIKGYENHDDDDDDGRGHQGHSDISGKQTTDCLSKRKSKQNVKKYSLCYETSLAITCFNVKLRMRY